MNRKAIFLRKYPVFIILFITFSSFINPDDDAVYDISVSSVGYISDRSGAVASGFFINDNTFITNHHVTDGLDVETAIIEMKDGSTYGVRKILKEYRKVDLAIIRTESSSPHVLKLEEDDMPSENDEVYSLGNPTDSKDRIDYFKMTKGSIKIVQEDDWFYDENSEDTHNALVIQHTAMIKPGNSGGPLLNKDGKVIGVNTFFYDDSLNYAVHVNVLVEILNKNGITFNEVVKKKDTTKKTRERTFNEKIRFVINKQEYYFRKYDFLFISAALLYYMFVTFGTLTILTYLIVKKNRRKAI